MLLVGGRIYYKYKTSAKKASLSFAGSKYPASSCSLEIARTQGVRVEGMIDPHTRRGDGVWTRSRNLEGMVVTYVVRRKGATRTARGVD